MNYLTDKASTNTLHSEEVPEAGLIGSRSLRSTFHFCYNLLSRVNDAFHDLEQFDLDSLIFPTKLENTGKFPPTNIVVVIFVNVTIFFSEHTRKPEA